MQMLKQGDHGPAVAEVRATLATLGLLHDREGVGRVEPAPGSLWSRRDTVFDSDLDKAVRSFQQARGLIVDGCVGPATARALREASFVLGARVLRYVQSSRMIGDDVATLQQNLQDLGFFTSHVDGIFGPRTHSALVTYQGEYGLTPDGVCGPDTLRSLGFLGRRITGGSPARYHEQEVVRRSGPQLAGKRVVINPALGGKSVGQRLRLPDGSVLTEADILWDTAVKLEGRMAATGVDAFLSRPENQTPGDEERASIANAVDADLMITLQCDAYSNEKPNGVATYYFGNERGTASAIGEMLAGYVQREIVARTGFADCRWHGRTWDVLRLSKMPSIVVSVGYLSNPHDARALCASSTREAIAEAILVAVKRLYLIDEDHQPTGTYTFAELIAEESF